MTETTAGNPAGYPTSGTSGTAGTAGTATEPPRPEGPPGWDTEHLKDYRALRRSRRDRKIAGVAGGLGQHLRVDPTIIRVLLVVLVFFGGAGILLYGAFWLFVPAEDTGHAVIRTSDSSRNGVLIAVAAIALLLALGDTLGDFWFPWPIAVIGLVVAVVLLARDNRGSAAVDPGAPPPAPPGTPLGTPPYPPVPPAPPVPPRPQRRGPLLFGITLALVAIALGALGLYEASGENVPDAAYPALALGVTGLMLVVGAFWGRPGGLVALGIVTSLMLVVVSVGNPGFDGDRDLRAVPVQASDVADQYDVPAGRVELDLTEVEDLAELDGRTIQLEINAGELLVVVPGELAVDFRADVAYGGEIVTPIGSRDGWGSTLQGHIGTDDADAVVDLELDARFGRIEVRQQ